MSKKQKNLLIVGIILAAILILIIPSCLDRYAADDLAKQGAKNTSAGDMMLADPNLLYTSSFWSGMCQNKITREEGGCYTEIYLFQSGKYIEMAGWEGVGNERVDEPPAEKQLNKIIIDKIVQTITDSKIMTKDCPPSQIMDAGWDYQINLDGVKKSFRNPPEDCQNVFDEINKLIDSVGFK